MPISFQSPGEIAFNILGFPVYYYGIILAAAIFVGVYTTDFLYKKYYDKVSYILDFTPFMIILGILGVPGLLVIIILIIKKTRILSKINFRKKNKS